MTGKDLE